MLLFCSWKTPWQLQTLFVSIKLTTVLCSCPWGGLSISRYALQVAVLRERLQASQNALAARTGRTTARTVIYAYTLFERWQTAQPPWDRKSEDTRPAIRRVGIRTGRYETLQTYASSSEIPIMPGDLLDRFKEKCLMERRICTVRLQYLKGLQWILWSFLASLLEPDQQHRQIWGPYDGSSQQQYSRLHRLKEAMKPIARARCRSRWGYSHAWCECNCGKMKLNPENTGSTEPTHAWRLVIPNCRQGTSSTTRRRSHIPVHVITVEFLSDSPSNWPHYLGDVHCFFHVSTGHMQSCGPGAWSATTRSGLISKWRSWSQFHEASLHHQNQCDVRHEMRMDYAAWTHNVEVFWPLLKAQEKFTGFFESTSSKT